MGHADLHGYLGSECLLLHMVRTAGFGFEPSLPQSVYNFASGKAAAVETQCETGVVAIEGGKHQVYPRWSAEGVARLGNEHGHGAGMR